MTSRIFRCFDNNEEFNFIVLRRKVPLDKVESEEWEGVTKEITNSIKNLKED